MVALILYQTNAAGFVVVSLFNIASRKLLVVLRSRLHHDSAAKMHAAARASVQTSSGPAGVTSATREPSKQILKQADSVQNAFWGVLAHPHAKATNS